MSYHPQLFRVGLLITEKCDTSCRHCWFDCNPEKTETMTTHQVTGIIDETVDLGAKWISFSGGEPFLAYELLTQGVRHASSRGLKTEVVTNGLWALDENEAQNRLSILRETGLDVVNISVDDFHQENISFEAVMNCYEAANRVGLKTVFMVCTRKDGEINGEALKTMLNDDRMQILGEPRVKEPSALIIESPFYPVGRGENLDEEVLMGEIVGKPCKQVLTDIGVKPNGDVLPCCGPLAVHGNAVLGNLNERSLGEILDDSWGEACFSGVYWNGPMYGDNTRKYVGNCHLCYEVFRR